MLLSETSLLSPPFCLKLGAVKRREKRREPILQKIEKGQRTSCGIPDMKCARLTHSDGKDTEKEKGTRTATVSE